MSPILWLLIGAWIGAPIGFFAAALAQAAAKSDTHLNPTSLQQAEAERRFLATINETEEEEHG